MLLLSAISPPVLVRASLASMPARGVVPVSLGLLFARHAKRAGRHAFPCADCSANPASPSPPPSSAPGACCSSPWQAFTRGGPSSFPAQVRVSPLLSCPPIAEVDVTALPQMGGAQQRIRPIPAAATEALLALSMQRWAAQPPPLPPLSCQVVVGIADDNLVARTIAGVRRSPPQGCLRLTRVAIRVAACCVALPPDRPPRASSLWHLRHCDERGGGGACGSVA